jgi:hypothetical protein
MAQGEWAATTELIDAALEILEQENPMTVRQLFYRLVSVEHIENTQLNYQRVSRLMTKARRDDRCPYEWIVDRSRPTYEPNVWKDPTGYAEGVKHGYRKDYWAMQPNYCEIWCEKDSITGSIQELTDELGIIVRVGRGFQSATRVNDIAQYLNDVEKHRKTVFYLGDWDPSGEDIQRAAYARIQERAHQLWSSQRELCLGTTPWFFIERIAIHKEDIAKFKLAPLRIRKKEDGSYADSRATQFVKKHGKDCVELDALPPTELRRRIQEAVESQLDMKLWNRAIEIEKIELRSIVETVDAWSPGHQRESWKGGPR